MAGQGVSLHEAIHGGMFMIAICFGTGIPGPQVFGTHVCHRYNCGFVFGYGGWFSL